MIIGKFLFLLSEKTLRLCVSAVNFHLNLSNYYLGKTSNIWSELIASNPLHPADGRGLQETSQEPGWSNVFRLRESKSEPSAVADGLILQFEFEFELRVDAVQLATALELENRFASRKLASITFISADNQLNQAAQNEGLTVDNPNNH